MDDRPNERPLILNTVNLSDKTDPLRTEPNIKKAGSYIAQSPVQTVQSALHFTSLTDLFSQTPYRLLWEASSHMLQLISEGCSYIYPPLSIARYSFLQLSDQEQCRVKNLPKILAPQHKIRTRVLVVECPNP